ncbi:MAG: hypothetical protein K0S74_29 [Chlamydiales bacterium]|jgi:hypothetical protein|nr:hypothetical protein [Chlamydiales bacterium]
MNPISTPISIKIEDQDDSYCFCFPEFEENSAEKINVLKTIIDSKSLYLSTKIKDTLNGLAQTAIQQKRKEELEKNLVLQGLGVNHLNDPNDNKYSSTISAEMSIIKECEIPLPKDSPKPLKTLKQILFYLQDEKDQAEEKLKLSEKNYARFFVAAEAYKIEELVSKIKAFCRPLISREQAIELIRDRSFQNLGAFILIAEAEELLDQDLINEARGIINSVPSTHTNIISTKFRIKTNDYKLAIANAINIQDAKEKAELIKTIAEGLTKREDYKKAKEIIDGITLNDKQQEQTLKDSLLEKLAISLIECDKLEDATQAADFIRDIEKRHICYQKLYEAYENKNDLDKQLEITSKIVKPDLKTAALEKIFNYWLEQTEYEKLISHIHNMHNIDRRCYFIEKVVLIYLEQNEIEKAMNALQRMDSSDSRRKDIKDQLYMKLFTILLHNHQEFSNENYTQLKNNLKSVTNLMRRETLVEQLVEWLVKHQKGKEAMELYEASESNWVRGRLEAIIPAEELQKHKDGIKAKKEAEEKMKEEREKMKNLPTPRDNKLRAHIPPTLNTSRRFVGGKR